MQIVYQVQQGATEKWTNYKWLSVYKVSINVNINININIDFKQLIKVYGCQYIKLTLTLTITFTLSN